MRSRLRVPCLYAAGIVVEHGIQYPVHALHVPVAPDAGCKLSCSSGSPEQEMASLGVAHSILLSLCDSLVDACRIFPGICHGLLLGWCRAHCVESLFLSAAFFGFEPLDFSPSS